MVTATQLVWFNMHWNMVSNVHDFIFCILIGFYSIFPYLFLVHQRAVNSPDTEYVIKLTYAELYNEEIKDLLSATPNENLKIIDDPQLGPLIQNITEANFTSAADMKALLDEGENRRHFGVTNMNAHSSRSHVIVRLNIESRKLQQKPVHPLRSGWGKDRPNCVSTLNLVDLAGSERASKSGTSGQSLKEGSYINRSLLTLGTVISNLSEGKLQHIPYRNSKLTRLLATALGGNAKTSVICCISPASGNLAESLNTLRFAARAKRVVNYVSKNEIMDMKTLNSKLTIQAAEIDHLKHLLDMSRQLGFNPDDDEQGETMREQAVLLSKSYRNLNFVVRNGPVILQSLRAEGLSQLAKKVGEDMKAAISGCRDVNEVVDEFANIVETYLPKNRKLLAKLQILHTQNESEAMVTKGDLTGHESDSDQSDSEDLVDLLQFGGEEMKEKLECAQLETEDLRMLSVNCIAKLEAELADALNRERGVKKQLEESVQRQQDQAETIRALKNAEATLHKQVEDIKEQWKSDVTTHTEHIMQLTAKIGRLEIQLADQAEVLGAKAYDIMAKESDMEKLRSQIDQLTKDLNSTLQSKKALEDETARIRNDMRIQMDRLRNNMHEMLMQGGEEAKVLQNQNIDLSREIDAVKDELAEVMTMKEHIDNELSRIRSELSMNTNQLKQREEEITILKDENGNLALKLREMRLEMTKLTSNLSFSEASNQQLQNQLQVEIKTKEDTLDVKEKEIDAWKEKMKQKMNDLQVEMDIKDAEIGSLNEQLVAKQAHAVKIEQSLNADSNRLEKKIANQVKRIDELTKENSSVSVSMYSMQHKHKDEVETLKGKIAELQGQIDKISNYVQQQQKELIDNQDADMVGSYNDDFDLFYYDSPMSRTPSMRFRRTSSHNDFDSEFFSPMSTGGSFFRRDSEYNANTRTRDSFWQSTSKEQTLEGMDFDYPMVEEVNVTSSKKRSVRIKSSPNLLDSSDEDESLYERILEKHSQQLTEYTNSLLHGLQLSTLYMEFNIKEEQLIRQAGERQRQGYLGQRLEDQVIIQKLMNSEETLSEARDQLRSSLSYAEERVSTLETRMKQLEQEHQNLTKDYYRSCKGEKVSLAQATKYEQLYLDCKAQMDKVKLDLVRKQQENSDLRLSNLQLNGKLDGSAEKQRLLEQRLDLIKQQMEILTTEKENLMQRVLSQSSYSSSKIKH
ncbi:hypothetical protein EON65_07680 [archaeon]|nr:MAG: hypothetical protein EON65_07680 [archaeon]